MDKQQVGPFLRQNKDWKIRQMVAGYLEARRIFLETHQRVNSSTFVSFEQLVQVGEILYQVKESHHLLFKRLVSPQSRKFEDVNKFTPNDIEISFMNNLGLLFHKAMVARELKYLIEHYEEKDDDSSLRWKELHSYLEEMSRLFTVGLEILSDFIRLHRDSVILMSYLIEDCAGASSEVRPGGEPLLTRFVEPDELAEVHERVARYYLESGWTDRAVKILQRLLEIDSANQFASASLQELEPGRVA
jgi:hypothetical protein